MSDRIRRWWDSESPQEIVPENDPDELTREVAWGEFDKNLTGTIPFDPRGSGFIQDRARPARGSALRQREEPVPPIQANDLSPSRPEHSLRRKAVVADPEAVSLIAAHGGHLYVYADASGQKHVQTEAPNDPSIRFGQIEADGFLMFVQEGIKRPEQWIVTFSRIPYHHLDVAWEGHPEHPHLERTVCMAAGHDWEPDPDSKETYPVILCRRCGKRRELAEVLVDRDGLVREGSGTGLRRVRDR